MARQGKASKVPSATAICTSSMLTRPFSKASFCSFNYLIERRKKSENGKAIVLLSKAMKREGDTYSTPLFKELALAFTG
jgi:hypothetical protein